MEKLSLHNKKTSKGPIKKKMGRKCGHFTKGKIQMANKHMKWCLTSQSQIKATTRYRYTRIRMAEVRKKKKKDRHTWHHSILARIQSERSYPAGGNKRWGSCSGKCMAVSFKVKPTHPTPTVTEPDPMGPFQDPPHPCLLVCRKICSLQTSPESQNPGSRISYWYEHVVTKITVGSGVLVRI